MRAGGDSTKNPCQNCEVDPATELLRRGFLDTRSQQLEGVKSLGIVLRMAEAATRVTSQEEICEEIVNIFMEETDFENASLLVYDREQDCLKLQAARGFLDALNGKDGQPYNQRLEFRRGKSLAWQAFEAHAPIFVENAGETPLPFKEGAVIHPGCLVCLPLMGRGVLNISASKPRQLVARQKRDLVILSNVAGHLLQSTELRVKLHASHQHLHQLVEAKTTEIHRVNQELRASMRFLESVIQNAPQGICLLDPNGDVRSVNPGFLAIMGCTPDYIVGQSPSRLFQDKSDHVKLQAASARKGLAQMSDVALLRPDGSVLPADIFIHRLTDVRDKTQGGMLVLHDLSRQKVMAERLLHTEKLRALGSMAGGIAHDFNNLLTTILGNVELLSKTVKDDGCLRRLKNIEIAVHDGAYTVRRLQTFTGLGHQQRSGAEVAHVQSVVRDSIELTRPRWKDDCQKHGVTITVHCDLKETEPVAIHPAELREVLTNLIFNAVDAMPEGGTLNIRSRQLGSVNLIEIEDTGEGMAEETRKRIFDPFFTTKGVGNSGLGLSVSYGLITRMGGSFHVKSKEGKGSTFTLSLPVAGGDRREAEPGLERPDLDSLRILVVDDEDQIVDLLTTMLTSAGHAVTGSTDGMRALSILKEHTFDLVLTDLGMPGVSGWDIASAAKQRSPAMRVVLLTGWGAEYERENLRDVGVDAVLCKPFRFEELMGVISGLLTPDA